MNGRWVFPYIFGHFRLWRNPECIRWVAQFPRAQAWRSELTTYFDYLCSFWPVHQWSVWQIHRVIYWCWGTYRWKWRLPNCCWLHYLGETFSLYLDSSILFCIFPAQSHWCWGRDSSNSKTQSHTFSLTYSIHHCCFQIIILLNLNDSSAFFFLAFPFSIVP